MAVVSVRATVVEDNTGIKSEMPILLTEQGELGRVRTSTLHNKTENFSRFNSNAYKGVFLYLVTYSHLP
ncbi:hypothetical protein ACGSH8M1_004980 [Aeromonas caviae]|nr:hypothetical protein ACGSH8M1_004980 [Aeromonas caviae]